MRRNPSKHRNKTDDPPAVMPLRITRVTEDGDYHAEPLNANHAGKTILIRHNRRRRPLGVGDQVLARLKKRGKGKYEAIILKTLDSPPSRIFGAVYKTGKGWILESADRNTRSAFELLAIPPTITLRDGDLVEAKRRQDSFRRRVDLVRHLGSSTAPTAFSTLAIAEFDLPHQFSKAALAEAENATIPPLQDRIDLTALPLVTIDGVDARDFDDAVYAEPTSKGWRVLVAIADVSHYVPEGSALDKEARERGNSVYLPDQVIPMLPERLSNDLCSLKPDEPRACIVADMEIDKDGNKLSHRISRAMMQSVARLTYDAVEGYITGEIAPPQNLPPERIDHLLAAFRCLEKARKRRGVLELELAERKIVFDENRQPVAIDRRYQNTSQKMIEEMMILANVAAAETLEKQDRLCVYRAHDKPAPDRVDALHDMCKAMGISFARGQVMRPEDFNRLLDRAREALGESDVLLLSETILRCQAQADYRITNPGHYGLGLGRYAHFTSPIRRYADLMVHRSLMGETKISADDATSRAVHISETERRATNAERRTLDRFAAALLAPARGHIVAGRITGIAGFGAFVTLEPHGAEGLLPLGRLPDDDYRVDLQRGVIYASGSRLTLKTGDGIDVIILDVSPIKGTILLGWPESDPSPSRKRRKKPGQRSAGLDRRALFRVNAASEQETSHGQTRDFANQTRQHR